MTYIFDLLSTDQWTALSAIAGIGTLLVPVLSWLRMTRRIERINKQPPRHLNRQIFGRKADAARIAAAFAPEDGSDRKRVVVLTGGPGTGKTTLARYFAEEFRAQYSGVLFLRSESDLSLSADLADFALTQKGDAAPASMSLRADMGLGLLTQLSANERWLVILDNAPDQASIANAMPDGRKLDVVITSRNPDWRGVGIDVQRPSRLEREEAIALLSEEAGRASDRFEELAEAVDYLPLALVQAGEWLRARPSDRVKDYLSALDKMLDRRDAGSIVDLDYSETTAAVLRLSYRDLSRDARAVARILAGFDPDAIDDTAFRRLGQVRIRIVMLGLAVGLLRWRVWRISRNPERLAAAFRELELRALLEPGGGTGGWRMHRITGRVFRTLYGPKKVFKQVEGILAASFPDETISSHTWPDCQKLVPHCRLMLERASAVEVGFVPGLARGLFVPRVTDYLLRTDDEETALKLAEDSYEMVQVSGLIPVKAVALAEFRYAFALEKMGRPEEAEPIIRNAIERLSARNPNDPSLGSFHTVLANTLNRPDRREAEDDPGAASLRAAQRALAQHLSAHGRNHHQVAQALNNLGIQRLQRQQFHAGIRLLQKSQKVFAESVEDPWDYRHAYSHGILGSVLFQHGYPFEAVEHLRLALRIRRVAYEDAPRHAEILDTVGFLWTCLVLLARLEAKYLPFVVEATLLGQEFESFTVSTNEQIDLFEDRYYAALHDDMREGRLYSVPVSTALIPLSALPEPQWDFAELAYPDAEPAPA